MQSVKVIYLDHGATSWPKPEGVLDGIRDFMGGVAANAGRSGHKASVESARMVYRVRSKLAGLFGIPNPENLIFTSGTTEGLNLVLKGFLDDGDRVLISPMEHNSAMRPLERLKADRNVSCEILPADPYGRIDIEAASEFAKKGPWKLICIAHGSNVNGVVQDIDSLKEVLPDVPFLVDAAQTAGVVPIDVDESGIEFLAFSGHKGLLGPMGTGGCYISPEYKIPPLIDGGTGSKSESIEQPTFRPDCYESGTSNLHGIAGLRGSLDHIESNGLGGERKRKLTNLLIRGIKDIPNVRLHSPDDGSALMASITLDGLYPDEVAIALESEYGILCRPGLHCSPMAHKHLGTFPDGAVRLAPGFGNTEEDIEIAIKAVKEIASG